MSGICGNNVQQQIERAKNKFLKMASINQLIQDNVNIPKDDKISALITIVKEIIEQQAKSDQNAKLAEQKMKNLQFQMNLKNQLVEKYKSQLIESKREYIDLEEKYNKVSKELSQSNRELCSKNEELHLTKNQSVLKISSMQNQVNYLLGSGAIDKIAKTMNFPTKQYKQNTSHKSKKNSVRKNKSSLKIIRNNTSK